MTEGTFLTVAVVDDEPDLRDMVAEYLARNGFRTVALASASDYRSYAAGNRVDIALLDVAMPGEDGLSLGRWIRSNGSTGLIFVTAAGAAIDRVIGLEIGADDYVVKPYDMRELLARVRSLQRRLVDTGPAAVPVAASAPGALRFGDMVLDLHGRTLTGADGARVPLTALEFDLLAMLAGRAGRLVTRAQILAETGGDPSESARAIDVRVTRLRRKIEPNPDAPRYLRTVRGEGYVFVID